MEKALLSSLQAITMNFPVLPSEPHVDQPVYVTRSITPDLEEFAHYIRHIFETGCFTNNGPYCRRLEEELASRLKTPYLTLCNNGTSALELALHAAGLVGKEVVTTPFSYVATVSALLWRGCTPVFADIDEETLCMDPAEAANALGPDTAGLLPVHTYGNICDVDALEALADDAGLTVVYDAAQCYGSFFRGRSVLDYGNFAICSLHATKVYHTVEGGCVISHNAEDARAVALHRAFGHSGDDHFTLGVNAKMSELHAAVGLCLLDKVRDNIAGRRAASAMYDALLPDFGLRRPRQLEGLAYNYAYYPVIFESEKSCLKILSALNQQKIFPRRYFYPSLTTLPYLDKVRPCPVAESVAKRVLCLPLYAEMEEETVERICHILASCL
jgi:dTDP-4-amino-4,6-dideoxygalactose transaminase